MRIVDNHDAWSLSPGGARGMLVVILIIVVLVLGAAPAAETSFDMAAVAAGLLAAVVSPLTEELVRRGWGHWRRNA